jgi:hypothetical protein
MTLYIEEGIMRGRFRIASSLVALLAMPLSGFAANSADRQDCAGNADKPDVRIAACIRVIDDPTETATEQVAAYMNRGAAYLVNKDYQRTIDPTDKISREQLRSLGA